jgi:pSer/pThr/pTyr-binding forkhead associated (FHA) protein
MDSSPIAPHSGSAAELRDRIEAERRAIPFVVFRDPEGRQSLHVLAPDTARVTIGRRPGNDVALEWDTEVSRVHAALEPLGTDWTITDDGISRNGTFVNGTRISGNPRLRDGDVIRVGQTTIVFRAPAESDSQATVAAGALPALPELTATQRQVLVALCRPYKNAEFATPATNQQIADEVHLSVDAVKAHLRALFARFGIEHLPQNQKRSRLVMEALQAGVVSTREL